jgi:hypothetical protein
VYMHKMLSPSWRKENFAIVKWLNKPVTEIELYDLRECKTVDF